MWNNIAKFTLLLMFGFMLMTIHECAAEEIESGRYKRTPQDVAPAQALPGPDLIEKMGQDVKDVITKFLVDAVSHLIDELQKNGKKMMEDARQLGENLNRTLSALAPNLLAPPPALNLDPFGLLKSFKLPTLPFPIVPSAPPA